MIYTYIIAFLDTVTQEPIHVMAVGEEERKRVEKAQPEHHVLSSVQNLGPITPASDYIKEQEGKV